MTRMILDHCSYLNQPKGTHSKTKLKSPVYLTENAEIYFQTEHFSFFKIQCLLSMAVYANHYTMETLEILATY